MGLFHDVADALFDAHSTLWGFRAGLWTGGPAHGGAPVQVVLRGIDLPPKWREQDAENLVRVAYERSSARTIAVFARVIGFLVLTSLGIAFLFAIVLIALGNVLSSNALPPYTIWAIAVLFIVLYFALGVVLPRLLELRFHRRSVRDVLTMGVDSSSAGTPHP